jgi:mevalonate kinase
MIVKSPAKLIITGEHSVLYNQTAVTCAINKYLCCSNNKTKTQLPIHDALVKTCIEKFSNYYNIPFAEVPFKICSSIPTKSGLGTSAALIVSILHYLHRLFHVKFLEKDFLALAQDIENFQHGKSSGIDIKTVYYGNICSFENSDMPIKLNATDGILSDIIMIHTGKSKFSTKDVVHYVKEKFKNDTPIWDDFSQIGKSIKTAIEVGDHKNLGFLLSQNQLLLQKLGIVGEKVTDFIQDLKKIDIYAKVCGAGTIGSKDNNCGFLGIFHKIADDSYQGLIKIVQKYHYFVEKVKIDENGSKVDEG